jgi:hypothetical protein
VIPPGGVVVLQAPGQPSIAPKPQSGHNRTTKLAVGKRGLSLAQLSDAIQPISQVVR